MVCALHLTPEPQHCTGLLTASHSSLSFTFPELLYVTDCCCSALNSPLVATRSCDLAVQSPVRASEAAQWVCPQG